MADADQTLKILIELGVIGESDAKAAKQLVEETANATKGAADTMSAAGKDTEKFADATHGLNLKKRELLESMRMVTAQVPILGEAFRTFFNPATAAIFGIVGAFEIWKSRVDSMTQTLGALEIPDLSDAIRQATDAGTAWDGMAKAVSDADDAFSSAEQTQERALKAINDQLAAQQKLLALQKQLAEQKLDEQKAAGEISPAEYEARKAALDQGANQKTAQMEIDANNARLAARLQAAHDQKEEADRYKAQADAITKKFGLGSTDQEFQAQQKAQQDIADARQKSIEESRRKLGILNEATDDQTGQFKQDFDWGKLITMYGLGVTTPKGFSAAYGQEQQNINQQEAVQKQIEQAIAERDKAKKERDDYRKKAEDAEGKFEKSRDELKREDDPNKVGSTAWQNAQISAQQKVQGQIDEAKRQADLQRQAGQDISEIQRFNSSRSATPVDAQKISKTVDDLNTIMLDHVVVALNKVAGLPVPEIQRQVQEAHRRIDVLTRQVNSQAKTQ